jgi:hypothetical protein
MSSNFWFRIASLGLAGALVFSAGCGDDDDNTTPPAGPDNPELVPNTALSAFADVVNAIEAEYYLDSAGAPLVVGGDTTSVANLALIRALGSNLGVASDSVGVSVGSYGAWSFALVDTTLQVHEAGFSGPAKYVGSVDLYGGISLTRTVWQEGVAEEINGGEIRPIGDWDVDSDAALDLVWADPLSNATLQAARLDSILAVDSYVARRDTLYDRSPLVYGVTPVGFVQEFDAGGANDRYHVEYDLASGHVGSADYVVGHSLDAHESHVLRHVDPSSAKTDSTHVAAFEEIVQDFTVLFWADSTDDRAGLFKPGEAIQGYHGQEIWTSKVDGANTIQLYIHYPAVGEDEAQNVSWVKVDPALITGEVATSLEPEYAPDLAAADDTVLVIILSKASGHDPADVWYLDRDDANVEYALTSDPTVIDLGERSGFNAFLDYWYIEEIWVDEADIADTGDGLSYDFGEVRISVEYELSTFSRTTLGIAPGETEQLFFPRWLVKVRFWDPSLNLILETVDYVEVSTGS